MSAFNLAELAKKKESLIRCVVAMIYGDARVGKTSLAASAAESDSIDNVYWFDLENGAERIVTMIRKGLLSEKAAAKIKLITVTDSVDLPIAFETLGKAVAGRIAVTLCSKHGRDKKNCKECAAKADTEWLEFDIKKLGMRDLVVIDSASQYADSIMHYYNKGQLEKGTTGMDHYREQGLRLTEFLTEIQRGLTNWIVITHRLVVELEAGTEQLAKQDFKGVIKERSVPMIGTKPFSMKVGKYFGHVMYLEMKMRKHVGGSGTDYKTDTITGSRTDFRLEDLKDDKKEAWLSLRPLFDGTVQ